MSSVSPLTLDRISALPRKLRANLFWEVDSSAYNTCSSDIAFEKEAWLSSVMLQWGCCAQIAELESEPAARTIGGIVYAPPRLVPRATHFPTAPVSPDAVLLTQLVTEPGYEDLGVPAAMIAAMTNDLVRRGARAIEAFGLVPVSDNDPDSPYITEAAVLMDAGFSVVAPHQHYPRLRLELDAGLGWKAGVEAALEQLLIEAARDNSGTKRLMLV